MRRPDILPIETDRQKASSLDLYDQDVNYIKTEYISQLADAGVVFDDIYIAWYGKFHTPDTSRDCPQFEPFIRAHDSLSRLRGAEVAPRSAEETQTAVILTSDHGDLTGEHRLLQKFNCTYNGSAKVPLIVSWPGKTSRRKRVGTPVSLVDLPATICSLVDIDPQDAIYPLGGDKSWDECAAED